MDKRTKTTPLVSIVIPVYNVEAYLRECVNSVLDQTLQDFEIILVDDGATDSSGSICDEYSQNDSRIHVIHQKNGGLSTARNTGLDAASGKYIYFLDSDDYIVPYSLEHLCDLADKEQTDVVFFDAYIFFTDCEPDSKVYQYQRSCCYGVKQGRQMLLELLNTEEYRTAVPLMLLRREYLIQHKLRFKPDILHEDELFTFYVYHANGRVAHCHEELYARRIRPASIMTGSSARRHYESIYAIYFELSGLYHSNDINDESGRRYLARMSRSVLAKYRLLEEMDQVAFLDKQERFKKDVLTNKGYKDIKLKIKCSKGVKKLAYQLEYKIQRLFER